MAAWVVVLGVLAACGRVSFDARDGSTATPPGADVAVMDDASSCGVCTNLVSGYAFADPANLGMDSIGTNHMVDLLEGTPLQSTDVPPGSAGYSLLLDGASTMCIASGFTFDQTRNHTLCWWSKPTNLQDTTNQFAQFCQYDTWTTNTGADYRWTINNCNGDTPVDLVVPNVYSLGTWVHICQTYDSATLTRTAMIVSDQVASYPQVDPVPIGNQGLRWCIGSYGGGGYWTGLIHRPMWFDRILTEAEILRLHAGPCCFP